MKDRVSLVRETTEATRKHDIVFDACVSSAMERLNLRRALKTQLDEEYKLESQVFKADYDYYSTKKKMVETEYDLSFDPNFLNEIQATLDKHIAATVGTKETDTENKESDKISKETDIKEKLDTGRATKNSNGIDGKTLEKHERAKVDNANTEKSEKNDKPATDNSNKGGEK